MKYLDLKAKINTNIFTLLDVEKHFTNEDPQSIKIQLSRFTKKGQLTKIKRGLYCLDRRQVDELVIANNLYSPSYISLETALNYYGIAPDVPQGVTSISPTISRKIINKFGNFYYSKITLPLFFGFTKVKSPQLDELIMIAEPEKALLDYFYIRKIKQIVDLRLNLSHIDHHKFSLYTRNFPVWTQEIKI